ncbi:hypothetical protein BDV95DRAFT_624973 [Massariosphaeria phaeospora]|uniref:NAD(P)-binding protein n=1 Tax=Massariosphaeria phaeospora TaxID=100035 RepID=A0A7C8IK93_9PLEO|nr:hypothetical protein BDV95DRAFT_624973 [Massariosphaeria phaeospora]
MSLVTLILGVGSNIGQGTASAFAAAGYKVASVSRSQKESDSTAQNLYIAANLSTPEAIVAAFAKTKKVLGVPNVVVCNLYAHTASDAENPLAQDLAAFTSDFALNTISPFQLPPGTSKTFIFTGNMLNVTTAPGLLNLGLGKVATAHTIETAAKAYQDRGYSGEAHGKLYVELAQDEAQRPWCQTFVKDQGYKKF